MRYINMLEAGLAGFILHLWYYFGLFFYYDSKLDTVLFNRYHFPGGRCLRKV